MKRIFNAFGSVFAVASLAVLITGAPAHALVDDAWDENGCSTFTGCEGESMPEPVTAITIGEDDGGGEYYELEDEDAMGNGCGARYFYGMTSHCKKVGCTASSSGSGDTFTITTTARDGRTWVQVFAKGQLVACR
jgi:hypothetical protein